MNHPEATLLAAYAESPHRTAYPEVRWHLVSCPECRGHISSLQLVIRQIQTDPSAKYHRREVETGKHLTGEHLTEVVISDYLEGKDENRAEIRQHLASCGYCAGGALHFAVESAGTHEAKLAGKTAMWDRPFQLLRKILSWRAPIWAPAGALAAMALFVMILARDKTVIVVSYQDRPEMVFTSKKGELPGIGFFEGARKKHLPYKGVRVSIRNGRNLYITWPEVKSARRYEVKLYAWQDGVRTLVGQAGTSGKREVSLPVAGFVPGRRYEWELSGMTEDEQSFLARGGLVVGTND